MKWDAVYATRRALGRRIFTKNRAPIVTQNLRYYYGVYHALTEDLREAVSQHAPERAAEFNKVEAAYQQGISLINGRWGRRILRAAQDQTEERLVPAAYAGNARNIEQVYEIVGGKTSPAGLEMQSSYLREMFGKAQSPDGTWRTSGLRAQLNQLGDRKLKAIFDTRTVQHLNDLADILISLGPLSKMSQGSQTAFLLTALESANPLGTAIRGISYALYGGMWGVAAVLGDIGFNHVKRFLLT